MTDDESVESHGLFENVHSSSHLTTWSEIQKRNFCYNIDSASYWYMNWGAKKWYVVRGICVLREKELMRSLLSFFLTLNAESPGLFARMETVFPCFPTASAVVVTTSFFFLSFREHGAQAVSYWLRILRRIRPRLCDYTGKETKSAMSQRQKQKKQQKKTTKKEKKKENEHAAPV